MQSLMRLLSLSKIKSKNKKDIMDKKIMKMKETTDFLKKRNLSRAL